MIKKIIILIFFFNFYIFAFGEDKNTINENLQINTEIKTTTETQKKSGITEDVNDVINHFKKWDEELSSLKADFYQEVFFTQANIKQKVEGNISYKKKDKLRIEHIKPSRQIIITDKINIYIHKVEDDLVYKTSWSYWKKAQNFSGILEFGNYADIIEKNNINVSISTSIISVQFKNKENPSLYTLTLFLSPDDYFPYEANMEIDKTIIKTRLLNVKINEKIDDKIFEFQKPKKAEIMEINSK